MSEQLSRTFERFRKSIDRVRFLRESTVLNDAELVGLRMKLSQLELRALDLSTRSEEAVREAIKLRDELLTAIKALEIPGEEEVRNPGDVLRDVQPAG